MFFKLMREYGKAKNNHVNTKEHLVALLIELFQPAGHLRKEELPVVQVSWENFSRRCSDHAPVQIKCRNPRGTLQPMFSGNYHGTPSNLSPLSPPCSVNHSAFAVIHPRSASVPFHLLIGVIQVTNILCRPLPSRLLQ